MFGFGQFLDEKMAQTYLELTKEECVMGFADLSLAEIAEDYKLKVEIVCQLCEQLGIRYQDVQTKLALEDAKAIILAAQNQKKST